MENPGPLILDGESKEKRREMANAVRALTMDAVQTANSGHPGAPMGMADIIQVLWNDYLRFNPGNPNITTLCMSGMRITCIAPVEGNSASRTEAV